MKRIISRLLRRKLQEEVQPKNTDMKMYFQLGSYLGVFLTGFTMGRNKNSEIITTLRGVLDNLVEDSNEKIPNGSYSNYEYKEANES